MIAPAGELEAVVAHAASERREFRQGQANAADAFSTDGQLSTGNYTPLADTKHIFGFQNVAPVVSKKLTAAYGAKFTNAVNALSAKLTNAAMIAMNKAVDVDKKKPAAVAAAFLKANGLA